MSQQTYTPEQLQEILAKHKAFWNGESGAQRADLRGAYLQGADLRRAYLRGADLEGAYLRGADLRGADLQGAYLRRADLRGAYLRGAYLRGADLEGADLRRADLEGADLRGADLRRADLRGAYLRRADLEGADLEGADLRRADLEGAYLEDGLQISGRVITGHVNQYAWMGAETNRGLWLMFGCERRLLTSWDDHLPALCMRHEPGDAAYYQATISAIMGLVRAALDGIRRQANRENAEAVSQHG